MKKFGKIFFNILFVLIIIVTVIFIISFFIMKKNNNKYINIFGYTIMQVATGSMSNTLNIDDIVIVKITKEVNENDIITYEDNNSLITHRIIQKNGKKIITKGDANNSQDKPITKEDIVGKVIYIIPKVGIWKKVLVTPQVIISGSITLCLLYCACTSKDKRKDTNV